MTDEPRRQIHLGAHFPGVNNTTVWSDPASGSHIEFASFVHLIQTAERAKFDFFFLAEGLRLREKKGLIHDLDVVGRPDTLPVLASLAAVTDRIGLVGTINATFNEPYELARQFATLDHLSRGRAGWNVVTSSDAFTGENFRRGGYLPYEARYERAADVIDAARTLWDSWDPDALVVDADAGRYWRDPDTGTFDHAGPHARLEGRFPLPRSPQRHPVLLQAGDSGDGRDFGAAYADAIFTFTRGLEGSRAYRTELRERRAAAGRNPESLLILPAATFALGDTPEEAEEHAAHVRRLQVSGATAIQVLERVWNRDLSAYDPDGPLPDVEPETDATPIVQGETRVQDDPRETVRAWRALAQERGYSIRDLAIEVSGRQTFVGTPASVADQIDAWVQTGAADGFILVPHITPADLDEFAAKVVPLLQERGSFRADYDGVTLRDHLGIGAPGSDLLAPRAPEAATAGAGG